MREWKPIKTAPKDGTWILLNCELNTKDNMAVAHYEDDKWIYDEDWQLEYGNPTHWTELPDPPKK